MRVLRFKLLFSWDGAARRDAALKHIRQTQMLRQMVDQNACLRQKTIRRVRQRGDRRQDSVSCKKTQIHPIRNSKFLRYCTIVNR